MILCGDLCSAVQYLRQVNLIHRDIKPDNILLAQRSDGRNIYKLGDFGSARILRAKKTYTSLHGTFEFLHPDIFGKLFKAGLDDIDPDVMFDATHELWSIGATLYVSATGELPFLPQNGRENYKTMYAMITRKGRNHISAKELKGGGIKWSSELPAHALGNMPKCNVALYLAGLLNVRFK